VIGSSSASPLWFGTSDTRRARIAADGTFGLGDTDYSHYLAIKPGSNLTADRTLTITTGDADRSITLNGNTTLTGTNTGDQTITLTGDVTGSGTGSFATTLATVTIAKGGTGQTTATAAFDALAPTTTQGDIIYHNGTDNVRLAKGTASQVLTMNSGATAPEWATPAVSSIASVALGAQVFASVTKTNIGTSYADIYATAFDNENLAVVDFTGISHIRIIYMVDYVGAGTQQYRWVNAADNTQVLAEASTITADADPADTGWVALPAAFSGTTKTIEMQGKSTTGTDDPVVKGYAIYVKSTAGQWVYPAFDAAVFTGNGAMTWTVASGDVSTLGYTRVGNTVTVSWALNTTTVGGTPNTGLQITIPGGFTASKIMWAMHRYRDNAGASTIGFAFVAASGTTIVLNKIDQSNWTASADQTYSHGQITFEVN
jgi:hypothetical protein